MSRANRLNEEKHKYVLSFEKDFGNDLNKAKVALDEMSSENEGQILRKTYLKEWIANQEAPIDQKLFQDQQIRIARNANNIAILAFLASIVAIIISLSK